jgi:thymidylate synthase (FAD)
MKILRNAGTHKILAIMQPFKEGSMTPGSPLELIELAGRTAYQSRDKITPDSAERFVRRIIERKHESVLEHSAMTVEFNNVSRGFTHELVRHRLASFTQESTRYVDESDFEVVVPPHRNDVLNTTADLESNILDIDYVSEIDGDKHPISVDDWLLINESVYRQLRKAGWAAQDARQVLPIAIKSQIVCTANFREWRHIFQERTAQAAHWEIRRVMIALWADVLDAVPHVFNDIQPEFTRQEALDWGWTVSDHDIQTGWTEVMFPKRMVENMENKNAR